ncbi:AraC-type DNA-binding protein [Paenibacillus sp. UNCCL117]|uniref:AraC family transcriptional regulator n=1 Tax=unclassified Paenibacillus TaxID=185978 RepID=UPI00088701F4|nr:MULTISPECIES: AraC family transcriptional regulator [unclassified Paenibacillus]SDC48812.1 AraC-type DNA-binding protein [Paenibacillus sp. cl123]SFW11873.1 AraC-type DNA-binding protein [Paenibacillus sp. UNCCL117]
MLSLQSVFVDDMDPYWVKDETPTLHHILILVTHGKLHYHLEGVHFPLAKGDMLFIPKGMRRSGFNDPAGPHQKYSAHFLLDAPSRLPWPDPYKPRKASARNSEYLKQRFKILAQQWTGQLPAYETIGQGIVIELLGWLAQESEAEHFSSVKLELIKQVQDYLREHYREPVRIAELAELIDRTPNHVTQTFKEITGVTPIAYMHQLRIHTARDLILNTRMSIGEVSDYLGYSDQAHFNRMFKKIMGCPPSRLFREV